MKKTPQLTYAKSVLHKVSFNRQLFYKELEKAYEDLDYSESILLNRWVLGYIRKNPQLREETDLKV